METWTKIGIITPYFIIIILVIGYFLRKKDDTLMSDHDLLVSVKNDVDEIKKKLQSDKGKWIYYMETTDVHERWISNISQAIRQIKIFHWKNHSREDINVDELIERPPERKH